MAAHLKLVIVTPEKPVLDTEADFVALPAYEGEMGVLPGHVPALVQLTEGVLRYKRGEQESTFAIMAGYAEVIDDEVSVFAEAAELAAEIDEEHARQSLQKAKSILASRGTEKDLDVDAANAAMRRAFTRLKVVRKLRPQGR